MATPLEEYQYLRNLEASGAPNGTRLSFLEWVLSENLLVLRDVRALLVNYGLAEHPELFDGHGGEDGPEDEDGSDPE